jgi:hypothetical protein
MQGHHKDRNVGGTAPDFSRSIQTIHFGHLEIKHHDVWGGLPDPVDRLPAVGGFRADLPVVLLFEQFSQTAPHEVAIIRNQDTDRGSFRACAPKRHT